MTSDSASDSKSLEESLSFKPGDLLVAENAKSRKLFILKRGKVRVFKDYLGQKVTLAILGEGEIFGELSFLDAEPRSASVEALTDVDVGVIDGFQAAQQIESLPSWITPIFRSVFHRFREVDQKITSLQSMNEYQKKAFRNDNVAQAVYSEVIRFLKTLKILYSREKQALGSVKSAQFLRELDDVLGKRTIGLKVFWKLLGEYDFIDHAKDSVHGEVVVNEQSLDSFIQYVSAEADQGGYLMLGHPALAVLRRLVSFTHSDEFKKVHRLHDYVQVPFSEISVETIPLYDEALKELKAKAVLNFQGHKFNFKPDQLSKVYLYQSVLKNFDHTIVNLD